MYLGEWGRKCIISLGAEGNPFTWPTSLFSIAVIAYNYVMYLLTCWIIVSFLLESKDLCFVHETIPNITHSAWHKEATQIYVLHKCTCNPNGFDRDVHLMLSNDSKCRWDSTGTTKSRCREKWVSWLVRRNTFDIVKRPTTKWQACLASELRSDLVRQVSSVAKGWCDTSGKKAIFFK